jgi:hypothetical protein
LATLRSVVIIATAAALSRVSAAARTGIVVVVVIVVVVIVVVIIVVVVIVVIAAAMAAVAALAAVFQQRRLAGFAARQPDVPQDFSRSRVQDDLAFAFGASRKDSDTAKQGAGNRFYLIAITRKLVLDFGCKISGEGRPGQGRTCNKSDHKLTPGQHDLRIPFMVQHSESPDPGKPGVRAEI